MVEIMKKKIIKETFKNILITNVLILIFILMIFILAILYKYMLCNQKSDSTLEVSSNIVELYNTTDQFIEEKEITGKKINDKLNDWELLLVNKNNQIPQSYEVDLEKIEGNHKADSRIVSSLKQMLADAREIGLDPIICSSFRTNSMQEKLYNNKVNQYKKLGYNLDKATELASYWVAIPNTGEHETGLAVDIVSSKYQILDENQENTEVQKWLIDNSYKYGLILRYPTDKKEITMINYEPWHYRYVGEENAKIMKEKGFCLEEYIQYLKEN